MAFGNRVKALRQQREMTLRKLSEKAGVSYSLLHNIEDGQLQPSKEAVHSLARALRYENVSELLLLAGYESE